MKTKLVLASLLLLNTLLTVTADYTEHEELKILVDELVSEYSFDRNTLTSIFKEVEHKPVIIEAMKSPAESISWFKYRKIFMQNKRVNDGVRFVRKHKEDLDRAFEEYQVPEHIIAAVIGVETNYGSIMGSFRVIDALATLGFDYPPRAPFFRSELKHFIILACEERIKPFDADDACDREQNNLSSGKGRTIYELVGSYAGAMGYGQFIPSSYRNFAIDFDSDGMRDIWTNTADAIGSVANYFAEHQWTNDGVVLEIVESDASDDVLADYANSTLKPSKTVAEWQTLGIKSAAPSTLNAALFTYKKDEKEQPTLEYVLGFDNFYSISRYNHSRLYVRVVYELAEAIRKKL